MHHQIAVIDDRTVITGSFNWSPSAAHQNDETLLVIESPLLAAHFRQEVDRLWQGATLGISTRLQRKMERQRLSCGSGTQRDWPGLGSWLSANTNRLFVKLHQESEFKANGQRH